MRTLIEDSWLSRAIDDAKRKWTRADDAWETVIWVLARDPLAGVALTESGLTRMFVFDGARSIDMPSVRVIYEATLMAIVVRDAFFEDSKFPHIGRA